MPSKTNAEQRRRLLSYGMTAQEVEIWFALGKVAGDLLNLPTLHPSERDETVRDIHNLQTRLLARAGMRAMGWGQ
jgi:hypothetical protein